MYSHIWGIIPNCAQEKNNLFGKDNVFKGAHRVNMWIVTVRAAVSENSPRLFDQTLSKILSWFYISSIWRGLLAPAQPRRVRGDGDGRGIRSSHTLLQGGIRALSHHLQLPIIQKAQAEAAWDPHRERKDPQRPAAPTAPAASAQTWCQQPTVDRTAACG